MNNYALYSTTSGKILATGVVSELQDMLVKPDGVSDVTHYITWTSVDSYGRPVDPTFTPRELLVATIGAQIVDTVTVTIPTTAASLVVYIDGVPNTINAENGNVVITFTSAVDTTWSMYVDELDKYLPVETVSVTYAV